MGFNKLRKECLFKECFHKDDNCSSRVIKAHSIQKNKFLKNISINGEVISFNSVNYNKGFKVKMKEIGKSKASTFTGFCKYHDSNIFTRIENKDKDYEKHNKEQEFLFAYRSLAWFYYIKRTNYNQYKKAYSIYKNKEEKNIQKYFNVDPPYSDKFLFERTNLNKLNMEGELTTVKELEILRTSMNINLDRRKFHKIVTRIIEFNNATPIALSSIVYIEYDMTGNLINDYCNKGKKLQPVFLSVFPQKRKTYILISYLKNNKNTFSFFDEQIINQSILKQKIIFSNIIICYIENFFMSPDYWNSMSEHLKRKINTLYNQTMNTVGKQLICDEELNIFK